LLSATIRYALTWPILYLVLMIDSPRRKRIVWMAVSFVQSKTIRIPALWILSNLSICFFDKVSKPSP
jgi:hypothetical protein